MFTSRLIAAEYPPNKWVLESPLVYERRMDAVNIPVEIGEAIDAGWMEYITEPGYRYPLGYRITVPAGFVNDLASIPRILRGLIDVNGKHRKAAVLHDWLYYNAPALSRSFCDAEFNHAMTCCEVRSTQRLAMYSGVRTGGWVAYNKHKRRNTR